MSEKGLEGLTNTKRKASPADGHSAHKLTDGFVVYNSHHPTSTHNSPRSLWSRDFIVRVRYPASYPSYCLRAVIRRLRRRSLSLQFTRACIQLIVCSLLFEQALVVAALDDMSMIQYHDDIRVLNR